MSARKRPQPTRGGATTSLRDRLRPAELLLISAIVAGFIGVIVFISTRQVQPTLIFTGIAFIVTVMMIAMMALTAAPQADEQLDIDGQNLAGRPGSGTEPRTPDNPTGH